MTRGIPSKAAPAAAATSATGSAIAGDAKTARIHINRIAIPPVWTDPATTITGDNPIRILIILCAACLALQTHTFAAITAFTALHGNQPQQAAAIVVLGAGMDPDGTLHQTSLQRTAHGISLYHAGAAPRIHFTGGRAVPGGPGAGDQMATEAARSGIPLNAISVENRSLSTLQNALFSQQTLNDAPSVILVTEAFHLPRAAASFWWMGYDNISISHSARFRRTASGKISLRMLGRETLAVWFNLGRAILWSATGQQHDYLLH